MDPVILPATNIEKMLQKKIRTGPVIHYIWANRNIIEPKWWITGPHRSLSLGKVAISPDKNDVDLSYSFPKRLGPQ